MLLKEYGHTFDQRGAGFLHMVASSALRMENLSADLLAYTEASGIPDELPELTDSREALEAALGNLSAAIHETHA